MGAKSASSRNLIIIFIVGLILVVWGGFNLLATDNEDDGPQVLSAPSLGDPNAPITVIEFADFQCIYCSQFALSTQPLLISEFVETGKVRFEWRHFPVLGDASVRAANAATCAHEQGVFWQYANALFGQRTSLGDDATFGAIASQLGLDTEAFQTCLDEERYADVVVANRNEGIEAGVEGTPTFLVNGELIVGARPIENWRMIFETMLAELE